MPKIISKEKLRSLLAESHKQQFAGKDFQGVAIDLAEANGIGFEDDAYRELQSAPDPECNCGFCRKADWTWTD